MVAWWVSVSGSSHPTQRLADSAACWSVDQVALSLWLRHWVYAYDEVKSNDNLTLQLYSIPSFRWGNEAEILTIVILRENKFFCHFKGEEIFGNILGERNFSKTLGDVSRGKILNF